MPDTANLAQCIVEQDDRIRTVREGEPVVLLPGQPGDAPRFAKLGELVGDDDDEPATVVKFSRAVQALRGQETFSEYAPQRTQPPAPKPPPPAPEPQPPAPELLPVPEPPPPPPSERTPSGEVPGLDEDVWHLGNPDWDIWMSVPDDEAPTHALPRQQALTNALSREQALTGPFQPSLDPLPALDDEITKAFGKEPCPDPLGLEILEETIARRGHPRQPEPAPWQPQDDEEEVELVYLLKNKKK